MSKLSRFKKAPAIKLPRRLPQSQPSRFDEDSDDDDFVSRPVRSKESASAKQASPKPQSRKTSSSVEEASVSEYFQPPPIKTDSQARKKSQMTTSKPNNLEGAGKGKDASCGENKKSPPDDKRTRTDKASGSMKNKAENKNKEVEHSSSSNDNKSEKLSRPLQSTSDDKDDETRGKVVCPFCWKKLGDKLTGTTHVKACAKDVPIQRVFEAMQLQEKQIEEWERLGLEFPGFSTHNNNKKAKNTGTKARGAGVGRSRRKKAETGTTDPEFELAVALSMSLHEELESRHTKENQFLIENGLEKEIGLVDVVAKSKDPVVRITEKPSNSKRSDHIRVSSTPPAIPVNRRRGKKVPVEQLPLYALDPEQKKAITCERLTKIIDDSDHDKNQQFYVRNQLPSNTFGVPKRLMQFQDKASTMWSCAQGGLDIPNESFSVLDLPDPKNILERTSDYASEESETPNNCQSPSKNPPSETGLNLNSKIPVEKLYANLNKVGLTVARNEQKKSNVSTPSSQYQALITKSSIVLKSLPRVVQDITEMLRLRKDCDLFLYGREEEKIKRKSIKCHSFMIAARCPKMLTDVIIESHGEDSRRIVPLTSFSHMAVKAFVWYIYTGLLDVDYNDVLMAELSELATTYDIQLDLTVTGVGQGSNKLSRSSNVKIQTDIVPMQDASIMTENLNRCSVETGNETLTDSKISQELFTTFYDNQNVDSPVEDECQRKSILESSKDKSDELNDDKSENGDNASEVDLFAYMEEEDELNKPISPAVQPDRDSKGYSSKHDESSAKGSSEEEDDFIKELLASPSVTQRTKGSEKKRSRSVSPVENNPEDLYSATQVANILQLRQDGESVKEYIKKANKKQKLIDDSDLDIICVDEENDNIRASDCDYNVGVSKVNNVNFCENGNKWNDDSIFLEMANDAHFKDNSLGRVTPKNNLLKSRRSVSTPNISIDSPRLNHFNNRSPFYNQQISGSDNDIIDNDPFADAYCDDSVFANIPDDILMKGKTPENTHPTNSYHKKIDVSKCTSQRSLTPLSHTRQRISPRDLSSWEDTCDKIPTTSRGTKKGAASKTKAKAPPKIKLPSRLPSSKEDTTNRENAHNNEDTNNTPQQSTRLPNPVGGPKSVNGNSKSPMMNYSLIDTPILKQELKKYGIKPLPRSKAKVLLRHIYKETHK